MEMNGDVCNLFQGSNKCESVVGSQKSCHIFDADTVGTHCLQVFGLRGVIVKCVDISAHSRLCHGVADAALEMFACLFYTFDDCFEISVIV